MEKKKLSLHWCLKCNEKKLYFGKKKYCPICQQSEIVIICKKELRSKRHEVRRIKRRLSDMDLLLFGSNNEY